MYRMSVGYATRLGNIQCNWVNEPCEKPNKYECEKYFNAIIRDSIVCVRANVKCYLFTQEQIECLKEQMLTVNTKMTFIVKETEDRFLIIPRRKRGMK